MTRNLQLPIGIESFKEVVNNFYYVDKTDFLSKLCNYSQRSILLFTRPRRFGKSLTLSMIDTFFNRKEENSKKYFENTKVFQDKRARSFRNAFPVIHLNRKDVAGDNFQEMLSRLRRQIKLAYRAFPEIEDKHLLSKDDFLFVQNALNRKLNKEDITSSLVTLTRLIVKKHSIAPVVLIDEYDYPLQNAYDHGFFDEAVSFFKHFYGLALKGNNNLQFAILTGVLQIAKESRFSGMNNVVVNSVLDTTFDEYFGFTDEEVDKLLSYFHLSKKKAEVKEWYDGYQFGNQAVYNPWSILNFVANGGEIKGYWKRTGSNSYLRHLIENGTDDIRSVFLSLLNHEAVTEFLDFSRSYVSPKQDKKSILSLLVTSGYLTIEKNLSRGLYSLKIPNKEIQNVFIEEVFSLLPDQSSRTNRLLLRNAFRNGELNAIQDSLEHVFLSAFSYFDFSSEKNYQILLLALSCALFGDAIIKSEVNEGTGRADISIASRKNEFGFIFEVKSYKGNVSLPRLKEYSQKALKQIRRNHYTSEREERGIQKITAYGIAFAKNKIELSKKQRNTENKEILS